MDNPCIENKIPLNYVLTYKLIIKYKLSKRDKQCKKVNRTLLMN